MALFPYIYMTTSGNVTKIEVIDHLLPFHLVIHWCYPVEQLLPVLIHRLWCVNLISAQKSCSKEGEVDKESEEASSVTATEY